MATKKKPAKKAAKKPVKGKTKKAPVKRMSEKIMEEAEGLNDIDDLDIDTPPQETFDMDEDGEENF